MKTWADFYSDYMTDIAGCTSFAAEHELRRAAQQFFEESGAWRAEMDPVTLVADVSAYDFDFTTQRALVKILSATLDGENIAILHAGQIGQDDPAIQAINSREFAVFPAPAGGEILKIRAVVKPSNTSTGIDDDLFDQYAEAIAFGARARLLMQKDRPYTDPALAAVNRDWFQTAIGRAKHRAAAAYAKAPRRVRAIF